MKREYTPEELERLHKALYEILGEIVRICDKHNIPYFIQGGTAIGAFFEQAILPWDDDIDVGMTRRNYERFLQVASAELGKEYFLQWLGTDPHTPFYFAKVRKNNTLFLEEDFAHLSIHQGIYIDVFPFDKVPDNVQLQQLQRVTANFFNCCFMGKEVWMWKHFGKCEIEHPTNRGPVPCLLNRIVDTIFTKKCIYRMLRAVQSCFNTWNTEFYNMVLMPRDHIAVRCIEQSQEVPFGPLTVTAPSDLETYLKRHYRNLRRYIPKEEQQNHRPARLSFEVITDAAPVALFVYNRIDNTRQTVEHLKSNPEAAQTPLYIFSDGGRDEKSWKEVNALRSYLRTIDGFREVHIIERTENLYLERNIMEGIAYVLERHDTIIVLEDDVCTSPVFLAYMNAAFRKYAGCPQVMHVAGFSNLDMPELGDTYFTPHMSGWGWGTWKNRWKYFEHYASRAEALEGLNQEDLLRIEYGGNFSCLKSLDRNPIPWDICWEIIIYKRQGLCLTPTHTLVKNIGIGNGTHFNTSRIFGWFEYDRPYRTNPITLSDIPVEKNPVVEARYAEALKDHGMRYNLFGKIVRYVYLRLKKYVISR